MGVGVVVGSHISGAGGLGPASQFARHGGYEALGNVNGLPKRPRNERVSEREPSGPGYKCI